MESLETFRVIPLTDKQTNGHWRDYNLIGGGYKTTRLLSIRY